MKLTYDPRYNVAYITLREDVPEVERVQVEDVFVDVAPDGTVVGIEFLNGNEQLKAMGTGEFVVVNEANGSSCALSLAI